MMQVMRSFALEDTAAFDGKKLSLGYDTNLSKMYVGTNDGNLLNFDIIGNTPSLTEQYDMGNSGSQLPFVMNAQIHDSLICADFNGYVYQVKLLNEM